MGLLPKFLHRGHSEPDMTQGVIANTAVATRHQSAQEAENRRDKGIDIDMIDPEEITQELQALAHFKYRVPKLNTDGTKSIMEFEDRDGVRPWAIAALGYLNKVWPTIWMTTYEADTTKLRIRIAFHDIRKAMTPEDKRRYGIVLRMVRDLCLARCEDMKEGHKPLLLKVKREELGVHMTRGEAKPLGAK
jgi:hypothetical protein